MEIPGQSGFSVQRRTFTSPIEGQFGISVQLSSNALIKVIDQLGNPVRGVALTISYFYSGASYFESVNYDFNRPVNRSLPEDVLIHIQVSGPGFSPFGGSFMVPLGTQVTYIASVRRIAVTPIISRHFYE